MQTEQGAPPAVHKVSAFMLLELAVVISVLLTLMLLVMSAQAKPRSRAYLTTDLSNHRILLQAMAAFAHDNGDLLPNPGWGTTQINWVSGPNFPNPGSSVGNNFHVYKFYYPQQLVSMTNGQLFPYVQDPRTYMCPADKPDSQLFYMRCVYLCSYRWNAAVNGYGQLYQASPSSYKLSQFRPDAILQWEGDDANPFFWNDFSQYPDEGISGRHGAENLVGAFGGSVTPVSMKAWYGNTLAGASGARGASVSPLPNRVWCNPGKPDGRP